MKILVATEKPFAKQAVDGIKEIVEKSGKNPATRLLSSKTTPTNSNSSTQ